LGRPNKGTHIPSGLRMALSNVSFEAISERDLQDLVTAGVPEGVLIDYKLQTYGRTDAEKNEFLKDVSSFANTAGGHLVIGMAESSGLPTAIAPLSGVDPDQELQRLESLARDGIEPRIVGIRMKAVLLTGGGIVIAVRVPKSWNPPHRVSARNTNRIYGRNSAGAYELSIEELRTLFASGATASDRMRAFRAERLARIDSGEAITRLFATDLGRLIMHIVPMASFGLAEAVDLHHAYPLHSSLRPIASTGYTPRINFEGLGVFFAGPDGKCWSYTQLFRNGIIEAVKVRILTERNEMRLIPSLTFDKSILDVLPLYLGALRDLNVPPPLFVSLTLQGVRGARLGVRNADMIDNPPAAVDRDVLELPQIMIEQYGTPEDYQRAIRPAFDALWNSAGYLSSQHFDAQSRWVGPQP
jgi:Putative DNA-binding domain